MSNVDVLTRTNMLRIQADLTTSQIRYTDHVSSARFPKRRDLQGAVQWENVC